MNIYFVSLHFYLWWGILSEVYHERNFDAAKNVLFFSTFTYLLIFDYKSIETDLFLTHKQSKTNSNEVACFSIVIDLDIAHLHINIFSRYQINISNWLCFLYSFVSFFIVNAQQKGQRQRPVKTNTDGDTTDVDDDDDENNDVDVNNKDRSDRRNRLPDRGNNRNNSPDRRRPPSRGNENESDESEEFSPSRDGKRKDRKKHRHSKDDKKRKHWKNHSACKKHGKHHPSCKHSHHRHHHHHHRNRKPSYRDEDNNDEVIDNGRNNRGRGKDQNRERLPHWQPDSRRRNPTFNDQDDNSDRNDVNVLDT